MAVFGIGFGRHRHFTILHYPARREHWGPCVCVDVTCLASGLRVSRRDTLLPPLEKDRLKRGKRNETMLPRSRSSSEYVPGCRVAVDGPPDSSKSSREPGSRSWERREARAPRAWFHSGPRRRASAPEWRGGGLFPVPADARPGWGDLLLFMAMMTTTTTCPPLAPPFPVKQTRGGAVGGGVKRGRGA